MFDARAHPGSGPVRLTAAPERPAPSKLLSAAADQQTSPSPRSPAPSPGRFKALSAAAEPERLGDRGSRYGREAAPAPQHPRTRRARHRAAHAAPRTQPRGARALPLGGLSVTEIGGCAAQSGLRHRTYAAAIPPIGHAGAPETAETTTRSGSTLTRTASSRDVFQSMNLVRTQCFCKCWYG